MNRILNINLGGYALTIDDDAYEYLNAYLQSIRHRFSESEGRDEILHDIESRLGELITQDLRNKSIVMMPDVEAAVQIMGKHEDFGAEPIDNRRAMGGSGKANTSGNAAGTSTSIKTGRRIFRDEDDATVGGVCSGMAAYFGFEDPLWMRLIFVFLTFISAGFWIPAYILMWILIPAARTSADRLAMRGEPINVDNIAREIEDGFERFGNKVDELSGDSKKKSGENAHKFRGSVARGVSILGRAFALFIQFFIKFWWLLAIIVGICLFISAFLSWIAGIFAMMYAGPFLTFFSPLSNAATYTGMTSLFFVLGIPTVGLCLALAKAMFRLQTPRWLGASMVGFWTVSFFALLSIAGYASKGYKVSSTVTKNLDLSSIDTLQVERLGDENVYTEISGPWGEIDGLAIENGNLTIEDDVDIRVRKSPNGSFRLVQSITSRGRSIDDATANATQIVFEPIVENGVLKIPMKYTIMANQKWRSPNIRLFLEVPNGKSVRFAENIYHHANADTDDYSEKNDRNYISRTPNKVFSMTKDGLICVNCAKWGDSGYKDDEESFSEFLLEGNFDTEIIHGEDFRIDISGDGKNTIQSIRSDRKLTLTTNGTTLPNGAKIRITTPELSSLIAYETGNVALRGFDENDVSLTARGSSKVKVFSDVENFKISLSGACSVDLTGDGGNLQASLSDGAQLSAVSFPVESASISASDNSKARINASNDVRVKSDDSSTVKVEGAATVEK
jgi:phage shock protein PspC (stress-responsive transcriptional regulator)